MNGRLIIEKLGLLNISDEQFAVDLGCSIGTVRNIKKGKAVHIDTVRKIAQRLGVTLDELLSEGKTAKFAGGRRAAAG